MMDQRKVAAMGQKAMRKQQTKAQKIFWPLQAGRPRQLKPGALEAVQLARATARKLYSGMRDAKLADGEGVAALIWVKKDIVGPLPLARTDTEQADMKLVSLMFEKQLEPVGIGLMLVDRESNALLLHARPFEDNERSWEIVQSVLHKWEADWKEKNSKFKVKLD